jgi:hypothetical protein
MTEFKYLNLPQELELEYNIALAQFMLYTPDNLKNMNWKVLGNKYKVYFTSTGTTIKTPLERRIDGYIKETVYNTDGKKQAERITLHGKKEGYSKMWNEDGVLLFDYLYKNNEQDGLQTRYYETGELKEKSYIRFGRSQYMEKYKKDGTSKTIYGVLDAECQKDLNNNENTA